MSLPISIGDTILLSQIAWNIAKAFTSGRKSAPAEFAEVNDLLFTLSEALKILAEDFPENNQATQTGIVTEGQGNGAQAENELLAQMVMNCRSTLTHLKSLVGNYMELDKASGQEQQKKWKDEAKKNWKKLLWTKEGGDITKLKTTLAAHINGLNLALSAINRRNGGHLKGHVESMHIKIDEIFEWFKKNLERQQAGTVHSPLPHRSDAQTQGCNSIYFSVSVHTFTGREDRQISCVRAKLRDDWLDKDNLFETALSIFQCCCSPSSTARDHVEALHVSLLPSSMLVQLISQDSEFPRWHMYAISRSTPHRTSSIYISGVAPSNLQGFEAAVSQLSLVQAYYHFSRNQSTSLVSFNDSTTSSPDDLAIRIISVLASKTKNMSDDDEGICTLSFSVGERQFSTTADSVYQILHYKSLPESVVRTIPGEALPRRLGDSPRGVATSTSVMECGVHQPHAEVVFQEANKRLGNEEDSTYYITFYHNTIISHGVSPRVVRVNDVLVAYQKVTGTSKPATIQQVKCDAIYVEFGDSNDAQTLISSLNSMKSHLFHLYLSHPLFNEQTLFHRFTGDMIVEDYLLSSATMSLIYDPWGGMYRVIVQADTQSVSVCIPLSPRQLEDLMANKDAGSKQFAAYFLVRDMEGTEVVKSSIKFNNLVPSGTKQELHQGLLIK